MASEYLKWKYRDVQPDKPVELTKKQRRQNWWYYHKWHVVIGAAVVLIVGNIAWHALTQVHPDYQIAYVSSLPLSAEEGAAWEARLSALGADSNGDGRVSVQLNQYLISRSAEDAMYTYASNIRLMADLESCESCFFLLEDPEAFQRDYEILSEDWIPLENGLYLARRSYWENRAPDNAANCDRLWDALLKEELR